MSPELLHDYVPEALDNRCRCTGYIAEPLDVDNESSAGIPPSLAEGSSDGSYADHESERLMVDGVGFITPRIIQNHSGVRFPIIITQSLCRILIVL